MISTDIYPNHHVLRYDLATGPIMDRSNQELQARAYWFEEAAKGDAGARLICRTVYHLTGWYARDKGGDVIGEHLSKVVKKRERGGSHLPEVWTL